MTERLNAITFFFSHAQPQCHALTGLNSNLGSELNVFVATVYGYHFRVGIEGMRPIFFFMHTVLYYLSWFACIGFAAMGHAWLGPLITIALMCAQVYIQVSVGLSWRPELGFATILMLLGILLDTIFMHMGFIDFQANPFIPWLSPPWMACLWLSFGFTMMLISFSWLQYSFILAFLTFFLLPFAYWLGVVFGAATVSNVAFYPILGGVWMILLPFLVQKYCFYGDNK